MREKLSPTFVQAMIWLAAVAFVALVAAVAFTVNQPPAQPREASDTEASVTQVPSPEPELAEPGTAAEDEPYVGPASPGEVEELTGEGTGPPEPPPLVPESLRPDFDGPRRVERRPERPEPEPPKRVSRPKGISEDKFIEASALMVLARESFTDTPEGRKSLAKACDSILEQRGIDKEVFGAYSDYLAGDAETRKRIRDRILERADELRAPKIEVEVRPTPRLPAERRPSR